MSQPERHLTVVACGAPPTADVGTLIRLAQQRGFDVRAVPTPEGQSFTDVAALEALTGHPVEVGYRTPADERPPRPDAVVVAPATFNTVNKAALGITDTHALGVIAEAIGRRVPVVMVPCLNQPLAAREPLRRSVASLQAEGVRFVQVQAAGEFPWAQALQAAGSG